MSEQWRAVVGHEGWYEVSNRGRVRSVTRVVGGKTYQGRLRTLSVSSNGYLVVDLYRCQKRVTRTVHSLVAEAFIGPCPAGMEVCHGPRGQQVNTPSNLRHATRTGNFADKKRDNTEPIGERHWNSKLTNKDVEIIRQRIAAGEKNATLAREFKTHPSTISMIRHRRRRSIA